jgi:hypothetical protein
MAAALVFGAFLAATAGAPDVAVACLTLLAASGILVRTTSSRNIRRNSAVLGKPSGTDAPAPVRMTSLARVIVSGGLIVYVLAAELPFGGADDLPLGAGAMSVLGSRLLR